MENLKFLKKIGLAWLVAGVLLLGASCVRTQPANQSTAISNVSAAPVPSPDSSEWPASFNFGKPATSQEIALLDIDVRPDGKGLPQGSGTVLAGKAIYAVKCAACHGKTGIEGPNNRLVSVTDSEIAGAESSKEKTIGNYWPYATTLFDYIRRAMPFNAPGSLTNEEVYALTAFLLNANKIIPPEAKMNAITLPKVVMPAQKLFVPDDRRGGSEVR
ncbi:c-type cytochrome [Adhaeribacter radiodurans]|uniref:Cytochrome c n=1 Tax=Adhaeribacter radiodurans TaxID=2745197 RepID=A0A7L7LA30_9BACT|nr:cytochrome c [Adhaeribacter radiodurans]QMU29702.1 cytochrome c [Adhaeribacter radiodurans]